MARIRTYSELRRLNSFLERYEYLALKGSVGVSTFGFDRWINQRFYTSREWRDLRHEVIFRDSGCDLGVIGYDINSDILVHHMNPVTAEDIQHGADWILDPEYLITTTKRTHNAIHYGDASQLPRPFTERKPNDTKIW